MQLKEDRATGNATSAAATLYPFNNATQQQNRSFSSKTVSRNGDAHAQQRAAMMPQSKSAETLLNNSTSSPSASPSSSEAVYQNQLQSESLYEIVPAAAADATSPFVRSFTAGGGDVVRGLQGHARFRGSGPAAATSARKSWRKPLQHITQNGVRSSWTAGRVRATIDDVRNIMSLTSFQPKLRKALDFSWTSSINGP